jgi:uncharacterized protein (DUF305 family)
MKKYFAGLACCLAAAAASAQDAQHHHGAAGQSAAPVFTATTAKPFADLMDDAMAVMDAGMTRAPMNGNSEHDFMSMMVPHHQGAIDMAKAVLLYSKDPEVRNLALGIIAEQQNEIRQMQAWLARHNSKQEDSHEHH